MEPIRPVGRATDGPPPVPAVRRLTPVEREAAARERERRRRERGRRRTGAPAAGLDEPRDGGGSLDIRA
jgi:ribosome assembly protein YihI (activator of Der GTPase)